MASWRRINQSKLKLISQQFRRCYSQLSPLSYPEDRGVSILQKPHWCIHKIPSNFFRNVRFYAAPAQYLQVKPKKEVPGKFRLNEEITGQFVRLVTEEGHGVISRQEALQRARELKQDLVEVQRDFDPPVCKIMNFKRELYKKQQVIKARAKEKAGLIVKNVPPKEVRVTPKIEQKDLEMKAKTVRRLMEDGYRVKCTVHVQGKELENEQEKLINLLTRFTSLIEDVAVVETAPRVEKRSAYAIIKHEKFGLGKKGTAKRLADVGPAEAKPAPAKPQRDKQPEDDSKNSASPAQDAADVSDPFYVPSHLWEGSTVPLSSQMSPPEAESRYQNSGPKNQFPPLTTNTAHPPETENRYQKSVPKNQFPPPKTNTAHPPETENRYTRSELRTQFPHPKTNAAQPSYPPETENRYKRSEPRNQFPSPRANTAQPSYPPVTDNRYKTNEPRNQYPPPRSPPDYKGQGREPVRPETQFQYPRRPPPANVNNGSSTGGHSKQAPGNSKPPSRPSGPGQPNTPAPSYGIFSNPNLNSNPKK